jgi:uncharacterized protein (TIGR03437 family)
MIRRPIASICVLFLIAANLGAQGIISTVAGGNESSPGDGGLAIKAILNQPWGVVADRQGNIIFADYGNSRIRKVTPAGIISTIAGTGDFGFSGDGGPAAQATINSPRGLEIDAQGNLYFSDYLNRRIRKIDTAGIITTVAGNGTFGYSGDGGPATQAQLANAIGIAADTDGNIFLADTNNHRIRKVNLATGIISTVVGTGQANSSGDGGPSLNAGIFLPLGIALDPSGALIIVEGNKIRKAVLGGNISTVANSSNAASFSGDNGPATAATLQAPRGVTVGPDGVIYVSDTSNGRVRRIGTDGVITTFAGGGTPAANFGDGLPANRAQLSAPSATALDALGNLFIADTGNNTVRKVAAVSTAPSIDVGGVVNASGYQTTLAPGTVITIFGKNIGPPSLSTVPAPNYPLSLNTTSMTLTPVNGGTAIPIKIVYASATQVAALIPSSITLGVYALRVSYNGQTSNAQNVNIIARSFGIATANSAGTGAAQATIGNVNGGLSLVRNTPGSLVFNGYTWVLTPAHPGDSLVLWGTGGGADLANDTGGSSGDQTATGGFQVMVGGKTVTPFYAGTSFGYPGLWQINFTLPSDITTGCGISLTVRAGGTLSNSVTIAVAPPGQTACAP